MRRQPKIYLTALSLGLACADEEPLSQYQDPWRTNDANTLPKDNQVNPNPNDSDAAINDPDYIPDAGTKPLPQKPDAGSPPETPPELEAACAGNTPEAGSNSGTNLGEFNFYLTYNGAPRISLYTPGCATNDVFLFVFKRLENDVVLIFKRDCYEIADYYLEWDGEYYDMLTFVLEAGPWYLSIFASCADCETFTLAAETLGTVPAGGYFWPPGNDTLDAIYTPCN